jgi:hypothetical protein
MLPVLKQYSRPEVYNYYFREDIEIEDIVLKNHEDEQKHYCLQGDDPSKGHLLEEEFQMLKEILETDRKVLDRLNNEVCLSDNKKYVVIHKIQIPISYYNIELLPIPEDTKYREGELYYDFSDCKSYFIMQCRDYNDMTILINSSYINGYQLIFRDVEKLIVEMGKIKSSGI